jgi:hypothetical protein
LRRKQEIHYAERNQRLDQIKTKLLLQIYNSLIGSVLQYASHVWQIGNKDNLDKLNTVQRKRLSIILGLPSTASLEAMEVMSGVIPLDFRREEIAIRDIGKMYSYSAKIPIKNQLDKWRRKENTDRHTSLLGLMCLQGEDMKKETKIDVKHIEEEFQFQTSKSPQEYWKKLGSSKTRTNEQELKGREI